MSEMQQLTVAQLREFLGQRGLPTSGLKQDLVDRAMAVLKGPPDADVLHTQNQVSDVDTMRAPQTSDAGTGHMTAPSSNERPDSTPADVTAPSVHTQHQGSKSPYQQAREDAMRDMFSHACKDDDVEDQHQATLQLRAQMVKEKFHLQREREKLLEDEYQLQQDLEDQEWKEKQELIARERELRLSRERDARDRRLKLAKRRRDLQEQEELLLLQTSGEDEVTTAAQPADVIRTQHNTKVLSQSLQSDASLTVRKEVDEFSTRKVHVPNKPVVSFKADDSARPKEDRTPGGDHVTRVQQHRRQQSDEYNIMTSRQPRDDVISTRTHTPVRKSTVQHDYELDYDLDSGDEFAVHENVRYTRGSARERDKPHVRPVNNNGSPDRRQDRHATSTPREVSSAPVHASTVSQDESFRQLVDMMNLPKVSLMTFDDDPMHYYVFMNAF